MDGWIYSFAVSWTLTSPRTNSAVMRKPESASIAFRASIRPPRAGSSSHFLALRARLRASGYVPNIARKNEHSMVFLNSCAPCLSPRRYFCGAPCSSDLRTDIGVPRPDSADGMEQLEQVWLQRKRQTHSRNGRRRSQQWHASGRLSVCEHRRLLAGEPRCVGDHRRGSRKISVGNQGACGL